MPDLDAQVRALDAQINECRRELDCRRTVYSRQVREGRISPDIARRRYDLMAAVIVSLTRYRDSLSAPSLFPAPDRPARLTHQDPS